MSDTAYDDALNILVSEVPRSLELARTLVKHLEAAGDAEDRPTYIAAFTEALSTAEDLDESLNGLVQKQAAWRMTT